MKTNLAAIIAASIGPSGKPDRARIYEALQVSPSDPVAITVEAALAAHESAAELLSEGRRQFDSLHEMLVTERCAIAAAASSFEVSIRRTADDFQRVTDKCAKDMKASCAALERNQVALKEAADAFGTRALVVSAAIGVVIGALVGIAVVSLIVASH